MAALPLYLSTCGSRSGVGLRWAGRLRARQRLASAGTIARSVRARMSQAQAPHVRQAVLKPAFARPLEFMAVVTGNGECARMVEDGFHAIPIRLLGM